MAIVSHQSFVPSLSAFRAHWDATDEHLGASGPLVLPGLRDIGTLIATRDGLQAYASSIVGKHNDVEIASGTVAPMRTALIAHVGDFNRRVRAHLAGTSYAKAMPRVPAKTDGQGKLLAVLDDMASLWATINAATIFGFTPPLLLLNDYALADFQADLAALRAAFGSWQTAKQALKLEREERNALQVTARKLMRDYRLAVQATFPPEHALVESLPRLSPVRRKKKPVESEEPASD